MMLRKSLEYLIWAAVFLTSCLTQAYPQLSLTVLPQKQNVLIVYSSGNIAKDSGAMLEILKNPIEHFNVNIAQTLTSDYKKGLIKDYDVIFYISEFENPSNNLDAFLSDAVEYYPKKTICWIYADAGKFIALTDFSNVISIAKEGFVYDKLSYSSAVFESDKRVAYKIIINNDKAGPFGGQTGDIKIFGTIKSGTDEAPFSIKVGKFWYFPVIPVNEDDYIVFCDILHYILGPSCMGQNKKRFAVFEIDGIDPQTSPARLRDMRFLFSRYNARLFADITPIDYAGNKKISDNTYLPGNITALLNENGAAVLKPALPETENSVNEQIDELIDNDIMPLAVKYSNASFLNDHFSTVVKDGAVPFMTSDKMFQRVLFVNYRLSKGKDTAALFEVYKAAKKRLVLRDAVLCISIDPEFDKNRLSGLLKYLKKLGYAFLDLRQMPNYVRSYNSLVFSDPIFYARLPYHEIVYGDKKKIDLLKFNFYNDFAIEQLMNQRLQIISEKTYQTPLKGSTIVDIPERKGIFLVKKVQEKPTYFHGLKKRLMMYAFGETATGPLDVFNRAVVFVMFFVTFAVMLYLVKIFLTQLKAGKYKGF